MANPLICLDTTVLIDYFRKKEKKRSFFFQLLPQYRFAISVITKLEIFVGATKEQEIFWEQIFEQFQIFPLSEQEIDTATTIIKTLRSHNQMIDLPDILIGATALTHGLKLATLNDEHFKRIQHLQLILKT